MLKLKKPKLLVTQQEEVTQKSSEKKSKGKSKLPPDTYRDEFDPTELVLDESRKLIISVKRGGDLGLPMCDVRQFQTTEIYTGFTKKGINFPIEFLPDIIEMLQDAYEKCSEKGLLEEIE